MNYKIKDIKRAIQDLSNIINDILNANHDTYQSLVRRFVSFIRGNEIVNQIVKPLLDIELDTDLVRDVPQSGWGRFELPANMTEHLALVLQLFCYFEDQNIRVRDFTLKYFKKRSFDENIDIFNHQVVRPAFRELMNRLNDFIGDELNEHTEEMVYQQNFQIFNVGDINAGGGSIAFGKDIKQEVVSQGFIERYIRELINLGVGIKEIDEVRPIIEEIDEENKKDTIDKSRLKKLLNNLYQHGKEVMIKAIINVATRPETLKAAQEYLQNLG